jgi:hypothetical protein
MSTAAAGLHVIVVIVFILLAGRRPRRYSGGMSYAPGYVFAALTVILLLWLLLRDLRGKWRRLPYFPRPYLLSKGELAFYHALWNVMPPGLVVSFKVRLSDVINSPGSAWRQGYGAKISQKHLDFVVVDAGTTAVRFVIELDDRTHRRRDRRDRDAFVDAALATAGVPILRVPAAASYDPARLRQDLAATLRRAAPADAA